MSFVKYQNMCIYIYMYIYVYTSISTCVCIHHSEYQDAMAERAHLAGLRRFVSKNAGKQAPCPCQERVNSKGPRRDQ